MKALPARFVLVAVVLLTAGPLAWADDQLDLANRIGDAAVTRTPEGDYRLTFQTNAGEAVTLSPQQFAAALESAQRIHREQGLFRFLNITGWWGVLWVSVGLGGQLLFTARMLIQWLVSERSKRSVVPVSFWWLSLIGASMLILYFAWRKDVVGILGQSTGWIIYIRNLWMIHSKKPMAAQSDPGPEPELAE
jgi:lipid-A-disaccharide synthase-like uncharacterized protein